MISFTINLEVMSRVEYNVMKLLECGMKLKNMMLIIVFQDISRATNFNLMSFLVIIKLFVALVG